MKEGTNFLGKFFGNKTNKNENPDTSVKDTSSQQPQIFNQNSDQELRQLIASIESEPRINISTHEEGYSHQEQKDNKWSPAYIIEKETSPSKDETKLVDFQENEERNVMSEKDEKIAALKSEIAEQNSKYLKLENEFRMFVEMVTSKINSPLSQDDITQSSDKILNDPSVKDAILLGDDAEETVSVEATVVNPEPEEVEEISLLENPEVVEKDDIVPQVETEHLEKMEDNPLEGIVEQVKLDGNVEEDPLEDVYKSDEYAKDPDVLHVPEPDEGNDFYSQDEDNTSAGDVFPQEEADSPVENEDYSLHVSIEKEFVKLSNQILQLNQEITQKFKVDESKDKIIDNLHRELQGFKDNQTKDIIKPIILGLIQMMDRMKKQADEFESVEELNPNKLVKVIKDFVQDIEDILYRQGIDSYNSGMEAFDAKRQQIVKTIKVDDPSKDKTVAEVVGNGYIWDEKIIRPERVKVYVYDQTKAKINVN